MTIPYLGGGDSPVVQIPPITLPQQTGVLSFLNNLIPGDEPLPEGVDPQFLPNLPDPNAASLKAFEEEIARRFQEGGIASLMDLMTGLIGELAAGLAKLSGKMAKGRGELENKLSEKKAKEYLDRANAEIARSKGGLLKKIISIVVKAVMVAGAAFMAVASCGALAAPLAALVAVYLAADLALTVAAEVTGNENLRASWVFSKIPGVGKKWEKIAEAVFLVVATLGLTYLSMRAAATAVEDGSELMAQATKWMGYMQGGAAIADGAVQGYEGYQQIQYGLALKKIAELTEFIKVLQAFLDFAKRTFEEMTDDTKSINELRQKNLDDTISFVNMQGGLFTN